MNMNTIISSVCALLAVCAICFTSAYSCSKINQQYNDLAFKCLSSGGNWIPQSTATYSAFCLQSGVRLTNSGGK